ISTATEKGGASSLLDSTQPNGRFSGEHYDGALKPSAKSEESRFSSGAVRGSAGNVVGVDANRTSGRFVGSSGFQSKQNFELFSWRNEILRSKNALKQAERALGGASVKNGGPRLTTAKEPKPIPYSEWRRGVRYGRTREEIAAAREAELAATQGNGELGNVAANLPTTPGNAYDPATIWMRGRAPIDWTQTPFDVRLERGGFGDLDVGEGNGLGWVELDGRLRSEWSGATLAPNGGGFASPIGVSAQRSPEEKRRAYQEYLTSQLLQTPAVNPLSPISVEFRDGVATIRGVVPTPSAREAAGRVLLAEPDVLRVENQLTYVRADDSGPGAILPLAPVPGASSVPSTPSGNAPQIPILPDVGSGAPVVL
ncbi:MAG: BON domain-containing protein, partial [Thermoguttaceae bacterium]|nr:BON domain-containing protein [Thermoguttaceae bacterium]